ncbi:MAG: HEAT repeat domain-containing protein [Planctomycetes bacterium]|nr:HEAT repeat domain-containing protein [Planctomycetota bacterium]
MPDLKGKKFVKFNTGQWSKEFDKIDFFYFVGWLISESENEVRMYNSYLMDFSYPINKALPDNWDNYKDNHPDDSPLPGFYTEINFEKYCEDYLADNEILDYSKTCVIAYWALKLDLIDASYQLLLLAEKERQKEFQYRDMTVIDVVTLSLAIDIRHEAINEANKGVSRPELLKKWDILSKLPKHRYSAEASKIVEMLKKMIEEDKKWKEPTKEEFKKMTPAEQAEYWIYKLRDHNAMQYTNPGSCSVFEFFGKYDGYPVNPAEELKLLDIEAIPLLIEHMDDPRPTRCVGFHRSFAPSTYYHLYIGDACEQIFEAISGISIYRRRSTSGTMMRDGKTSEAKKKAQEWWDELQKKGIKQFLIDGILKGDRSSSNYALRFLKRYPDEDIIEVLARGIENANDNENRIMLVEILARIDDERTIEFLLKEAKTADSIGCRATAAEKLHKLGRKEGLEIAFIEINNYKKTKDEWGISILTDFLCSSRNSEAIRILKNNFHKLDKFIKEDVIDNIEDKLIYLYSYKIQKKETDSPSQELRKEFEALLIHALDFEDQFYYGYYSYNKSYSHPRICDLAADVLHCRFRKKYKFDITASLYSRDVQIVKLKNIWRKENNLPLLPEIKKNKIPKLSEEVVKGLIDKLHNAKEDSEINSVITEIEKNGLSALQPMQEYYDTLNEKHPAKVKLLSMLKRVSLVVNEVRYSKFSVNPDEELKKLMDSLVGKPLDVNVIVHIINEYAKNKSDESCGIIIDASRDADNKGFIVMFDIRKAEIELAASWIISRKLTIDGERLNTGSGSYFRPSDVKSVDTYKILIRAFAKAANALPRSIINLRITAIQQLAD